ncbi:MAG: PAC2 family protein, partial [Janthinobacterium lividum]
TVHYDDDGRRQLTWPTTRVSYARLPDAPRDVLLVRGIEPSMRWKTYSQEVVSHARSVSASLVVTLGALLADVPHTRPLPVTSSSDDEELSEKYDIEPSHYEGPTGIVGVVQDAVARAGIASMSLWAAVPHYVGQPPSPKGTLALLHRIEEILDVSIPLEDLPEDARAWERGVDELASEDSEIAEYVQQLEEAKDTAELPEASGEAIAREFERYLRRRDDPPRRG